MLLSYCYQHCIECCELDYITHREECVADHMVSLGLNRDDAKQLLLASLC